MPTLSDSLNFGDQFTQTRQISELIADSLPLNERFRLTFTQNLRDFLYLHDIFAKPIPAVLQDYLTLNDAFHTGATKYEADNLIFNEAFVYSVVKATKDKLIFSETFIHHINPLRVINDILTFNDYFFWGILQTNYPPYVPDNPVPTTSTTPGAPPLVTISRTQPIITLDDNNGVTLQLPAPDYGDTVTYNPSLIDRTGRKDAKPIMFMAKYWPLTNSFSMTFSNLLLTTKNQLITFLSKTAGQTVALTSYDGTQYNVIFLHPETEFSCDNDKTQYTVTLEFQVVNDK